MMEHRKRQYVVFFSPSLICRCFFFFLHQFTRFLYHEPSPRIKLRISREEPLFDLLFVVDTRNITLNLQAYQR